MSWENTLQMVLSNEIQKDVTIVGLVYNTSFSPVSSKEGTNCKD